MSSRSADWSVVDLCADPVPADECDVKGVAYQYQDRGDDLQSNRSTLQKLSELSGWTGEAAEEFAKHASERLGDLGKAAEKYLEVADALTTYAGHVAIARTETWDGLQRALEAEEQRKMLDGDPLECVADPTPEQLADRDEQWDKRDEWASARRCAAQAVEDAVETLHEKASECAHAIRSASEKFSDGVWDHVTGWVRDHADMIKSIVDALKVIGLIVAGIALILALVGGAVFSAPVLAIIAGVLAAVGLIAALGVLIGDALLVTIGETTWGEVGWDIAGVALALVGGRAAIQALRRALPKALDQARHAALASQRALAGANLPQNAKNAFHIKSSTNNLRIWAEGVRSQRITEVVRHVDHLLGVRPSLVARLRHLDTELATAAEKLRVLQRLGIPSLDIERMVRDGMLLHWAELAHGLDETLSLLDVPTASDIPKFVVDEVIEDLGDLPWRLSTIR